MKPLGEISFKNLLPAVLYAAGIAVLYYSAYDWLIRNDWAREDYNYCYLVPLVVLYLVWEKREKLARQPSVPSWSGLLFFSLGILFFWVGDLGGELYSLYLSSWLVVVGLLWLHFGRGKLKILSFPLFLALFMFPPPVFINNQLTFNLKLISSALGVAMIRLFGISAYREGNVIDLGFTQLQVVDACSGLRYLFPIILIGILMVYFYRVRLWKRIVLVSISVPLTIFMNGLRIALTGLMYQFWGPAVAEGFYHGFSGWFFFMISFAILAGLIWTLKVIFKEKPTNQKKFEVISRSPHELNKGGQKPNGVRALSGGEYQVLKLRHFLAPAFLLGLSLIIFNTVEFREKVPIKKPFADFPLQMGEWAGVRQLLEQKIIQELDLSDYILADYHNRAGLPVNFYVAYYESQRKGESIHSPETCLPGSGWVFRQAGKTKVALTGGQVMTVNRAIMEKGDIRQLAYFWFPARGRILTNAYEMKMFMLWDSLTRHRTDGALVRVISPVLNGDRIETVELRMQEFVRTLQPIVEEFIPG